jgi:hypothetical protein
VTTDEILTAYERIWTTLARTKRPQFRGAGAGGDLEWGEPWATCAWLAGETPEGLAEAATRTYVDWHCVEAGCRWRASTLASAMIHLNNAHGMTFGWFAATFRQAWTVGLE